MADIRGAYNPEAELPSDRDPFAGGTYPLELTETDVVPTKAGTGQLFKFTAQVADGEHKGRLVWGQMNLQNQNPTAQEIGQSEFAALRAATGVLNPEDTQDFHYKLFQAVVEIEPAKGDYKAKNQINWRKTAKLADGGDVPQGKSAPEAANDNRPAANDNKPAHAAKRPWASKK
jgi:hypothetical protein